MNNNMILAKPVHMTLTESCVQTLKLAIQNGIFPRGSQLPPEMELIDRLGVSRTTLREALRTLEEQGLIIRRRGLGTFVTVAPILKDLSINFGITEMIQQADLIPQEEKTVVTSEIASGTVAAIFSLDQGDQVIVVDRIRVVKQKPVVWSIDMVPASIVGENDLKVFEQKAQSIYDFFINTLNISIIRGVAHLYPIAATKEMTAKLDVPKGSPLMRITQTDYDAEDRPVLYSIEYHIPDAFDFVVNRKGPHF